MYLKLENNWHHWCLHINFSHWLSHLKAYFPYDSLKFSIISFMLWAYTKHLNLTIGVNIQNIVTTSGKKKRTFSKIVTRKIFYFLFLENYFFFSTNQMCFPLWKYMKFFFLKNKKLKTKNKNNYKKYPNIFWYNKFVFAQPNRTPRGPTLVLAQSLQMEICIHLTLDV